MNSIQPPAQNDYPQFSGPMSQAQVAKRLGISKARVFQIERRALTKLARILERRGFEVAQ